MFIIVLRQHVSILTESSSGPSKKIGLSRFDEQCVIYAYLRLTSFGLTTSSLYGEVNSVKNTTINIWLNDGVN